MITIVEIREAIVRIKDAVQRASEDLSARDGQLGDGDLGITLEENEMEIGMGIHGEPGVHRGELKRADAVADEILDTILAECSLKSGDRVSVLVNSLGATPLEELYILYARVADRLDKVGAHIVLPLVGRYATSMEMAGASITLFLLDPELEELLRAPAECAFWKVG